MLGKNCARIRFLSSQGFNAPYWRSYTSLNKDIMETIIWIIKKIIPFLIAGFIFGIVIGYTSTQGEKYTIFLRYTGALFFFILSIFYIAATLSPSKKEQYHFSFIERIGVGCSALACVLLVVKLIYFELPGNFIIWVIIAFVLSFVIRPITSSIGNKNAA